MPFCEGAPVTYDDKGNEASMRRSGPVEQGLRSRPLHQVALSGGANDSIRDGVINVIQVLLEYGADPLLPIDGNTTIIHYCLCHREIVQPFLAAPGLDVEYRDGRGRALLLAACAHGDSDELIEIRPVESRISLVRELCDMGADLSVSDGEGNNAVHLLIHRHEAYKRKKMAGLILTIIEKCPSLITQKNNQGLTPFHLAVQFQQRELMQRFLELGANTMEPDLEGNTMAHQAAAAMSELSKDNLDQALALGHNINARNAAGETPIMKYIYLGDTESIRIFQDAGADLFTINNAGETLLHILARAPMGVRLPLPWKLCQCDERKVIASFKYLMA